MADAATVQLLTNEWREKVKADATVKTSNLHARDERIETMLVNGADAQAEADRQHALESVPRDIYSRAIAREDFGTRDLFETVTNKAARFGLAAGRDYVIIGIDEAAADDFVTVYFWG